MHPKQFFEEFVLPTVSEWQADPHNVRRAILAISQLDILAEHVILDRNPTITSVKQERDQLGNLDWVFRVVRDVHDTHKHGHLHRNTAQIKSGQQPKVGELGGGFGSGPFGSAPMAPVRVDCSLRKTTALVMT